jgi:hypothetical protein
MKGVVYTTRVSTTSIKKEKSEKILEIWIDGIAVCINERNECFRSEAPRMALNHFGSIEVPDEFCQSVNTLVESRERFEATNTRLFGALSRKFTF